MIILLVCFAFLSVAPSIVAVTRKVSLPANAQISTPQTSQAYGKLFGINEDNQFITIDPTVRVDQRDQVCNFHSQTGATTIVGKIPLNLMTAEVRPIAMQNMRWMRFWKWEGTFGSRSSESTLLHRHGRRQQLTDSSNWTWCKHRKDRQKRATTFFFWCSPIYRLIWSPSFKRV